MTRRQAPRKWAANWPAEADATGKVVKETGTRHVLVPPNGLGISGGALIDRKHTRADTSVQKATILRAQSAVRCIQPSRRGVSPHQRNPFAHPHPSACIMSIRPAAETVKGTGALQPMLHPGSSASVTPL